MAWTAEQAQELRELDLSAKKKHAYRKKIGGDSNTLSKDLEQNAKRAARTRSPYPQLNCSVFQRNETGRRTIYLGTVNTQLERDYVRGKAALLLGWDPSARTLLGFERAEQILHHTRRAQLDEMLQHHLRRLGLLKEGPSEGTEEAAAN